MIKFFVFILILIPNICLSSGKIHFELSEDRVIQGSLIKTKFKFQQNSEQSLRLENLEGISLGDTIYINQLFPVNGDSDGKIINGDASIMFIKVPEKSNLEHKIDGFNIEATWTQVDILPTELPEELLFGEFNFPDTKRVILWFVIGIGILVFLVLIFLFWMKRKKLKFKKLKKLNIKNSLLSPVSYNEVVHIWEMKHDILKVFPGIGEEFKKLEMVLFRYQFKPHRSKSEEEEVLVAYRKFIDSIKGGFDGV